jgi:tetratricopeptide (TPR) repeat protein
MTLVLALLLAQAPSAEALADQALSHAQQGRAAEAERLWKEAIRVDGKLFGANFNLGLTYFQRGEYGAAEPYLAAAAAVQPRDFNARYIHGAALSQLGRVDDAIREWRAALAIRPEHPKLLSLLAVEYSKGRYFQDAARSATEALRLSPPDPNLFLIAIKALQDDNDHEAALKLASRFVSLFNGSGRAQFEYGYELFKAGRREEALPYIEKATAEPGYEEPHYFLGELHLREGRPADAIQPLRRAIQLRKDYMAAWCALGRAHLQLGQADQALAVLQSAVAIQPRHPQPHLLLSQVHFRLGDEAKAAEEKALSLRLRREDATALEAPVGRAFPAR